MSEHDDTPQWQNANNETITDPIKAANMAVVENKWRDFVTQTHEVAESQADAADIGPRALEFMQASMDNSVTARDAAFSFGPSQVERAGEIYDGRLPETHVDRPLMPPEVPAFDPNSRS